MNPEIESLKQLASQKITKAKLDALRSSHADAESLFQHLQPRPDADKDDFESELAELESALEDLSSALDDLDMAEEKEDRDDAVDMIQDALGETVSAFETIMPNAIIGSTPRPPKAEQPRFDPDFIAQVAEIFKRPELERAQALSDWVQSAGTPEQIADRQRTLDQLFDCIKRNAK
ncbi:MAG: hypothetical protein U1F98_13280 [Verrucomicrobiota bacterium]